MTPLGHSFLVPMRGLVDWANAHHRLVCEARRDYQAAQPATRKGTR